MDNDLNIWRIIQVASFTKRRVEGEKGRCSVPCWSLADHWVLSPFKQCRIPPPGFFALSWHRKGEAKRLFHLGLQHALVSGRVTGNDGQQAEPRQATGQFWPELSNLWYRESTPAHPLGWGIMGIRGVLGVFSSLVKMHHVIRDYFTYKAYLHMWEGLTFFKYTKCLLNHVAVVVSVFLKLENENGMALKPTWEVKDDGNGVRTHTSSWREMATHDTLRQNWVGLGNGEKTSGGQFWRSQKLRRMRAGPEKEDHGDPLKFASGTGCLCPEESKQSLHVFITPLSHSASFSQNHMDKFPNDSSFLIPFITLPT